MSGRGHLIAAEEVGPNIFDLHCMDCPYEWQAFTWQGAAAAQEMGDRHISAVALAESTPGWEQRIDAPVIRRELFGFTGPKQRAHV